MPRRNDGSPVAALLELTAKLPWWAGAALAVGSYLLLHRVAGPWKMPISEPSRFFEAVGNLTAWQAIAGVAQYLLPFFFVLGAAVSALRRLRRKSLLAAVAQSTDADALDAMSWRQFELLVGELFRRHGFRVTETGGGGADEGIDLVLERDGHTFLVQCKQWKVLAVGVAVVRELYGVMAAKRASGGFVVTSGRFTAQAIDFAQGLDLTLIDGARLRGLVRQAWNAARASKALGPAVVLDPPAADRRTDSAARKTCPLCSRPMVRRTATRGPNAGRPFWGCSGFPGCRATRPIP